MDAGNDLKFRLVFHLPYLFARGIFALINTVLETGRCI